ncbi:MAG: prolyl-tRNA synthetase associated domain-containing protein [Pseudomonadota bacterium]
MSDDSIEPVLLDGGSPARPEDVFTALDQLGITHRTITHAPMRTVADSMAMRDGVPGGYSKNLFLRNRKGKMVVVTLLEHRTVDLKSFGQQLGIGKPSFASVQRLMSYLGVIPGAVTPLAVINDKSRAVTAVLDKALLQKDPLHFHPCDNSMTTTLSADDLLKYMEHHHQPPVVVDFDAAELIGN